MAKGTLKVERMFLAVFFNLYAYAVKFIYIYLKQFIIILLTYTT